MSPLQVLEVNVIGTAARRPRRASAATNPRVLVTSSAEVYGAVTTRRCSPLDESSADCPR